MRAPIVSLLFLLSAPALLVYGVLEQRLRAPSDEMVAPKTLQERRAKRIAGFAASWPNEPSYSETFSALTPMGVDVKTVDAPLFDANDDYWGLPDGTGRGFVAGFCAGCHSMQIVMQQRATRERWDYMLDWMEKKQNMPALNAEEKAMVLDYLSAHFGPDGGG